MLEELQVRNLGVIEQLTLVLGPGLTALTGETGAGKTLLVEAIELLLGGRADPNLVRTEAAEARVDGRFSTTSGELVVGRVVPKDGRSRAYLDGRPASLAEVAERAGALVDLHGQHAHQSLLQPATQRRALDRFAGIDLAELRAAQGERDRIAAALAALGGDDRARAREMDLLRFQVGELDAAELEDPAEDLDLEAEEDLLGGALAYQEAGSAAVDALLGEDGALDRVAGALRALRDAVPFAAAASQLQAVATDLQDVARDLRGLAEGIEPNPERLDVVRSRRRLLRELCRKYGDDLGAVMVEHKALAERLEELDGREGRAERLGVELAAATKVVGIAQAKVGALRRAAAGALGTAVESHLRRLAMGKARVAVSVGEDEPGDDVAFLLAANPGAPLLPLARAASGGELARAMLALRLVLVEVPMANVAELRTAVTDGGEESVATLIFDEVDAGIGGAAASAVGEALALLAQHRQVFVVTHLAQVAAWADAQIAVTKVQTETTTVTVATQLDRAARVVELARMLSGSPDSERAQLHAEELLSAADQRRA